MYKLIEYIFKYHFVLLFVLLITVSGTLFFKNNTFQRSAFYSISNTLTGSVYKVNNNIFDYFHLKKSNDMLSIENARLRNMLFNNSKEILNIENIPFADSTFSIIPCKVISQSTQKRNNYIMLNKGTLDGIEEEMGVISSSGVIGIVISASEKFCWVMSVLHSETKISVKIKKNNQLGTLVWEGNDYRIALLKDIPAHVDIQKGDTIISSGFSHIFPEKIPVGTIENFTIDKGKFFYNINVLYSTDLNSLDYAYVIESYRKKEINQLKNSQN